MKVGLLFGTFSPPHVGHLHIAKLSFEFYGLDEVLFIPSPQNPFKDIKNILSFDLRKTMLEKMLLEVGDQRIKISEIEKNLPTPSYTYRTIDILTKERPNDDFYLLLGSDNAKSFCQWLRFEKILEKVKVIAYLRKVGDEIADELFPHLFAKHPIKEISSSEIREKLSKGESIENEIPWKSLRDFIKNEKLYQKL